VVAIDGPAGSGKSTTARKAAKKLGWLYLDTGAMYRALTVKVLGEGISLEDKESIGRLARETKIELISSGDDIRVKMDGGDVTEDIRMPDVDKAVGPVCEIAEVREVMVSLQRQMGETGHVVAEGRDMGTVVFPHADIKFFMVATLDERSRRRHREMKQKGIDVSLEYIREEIERRDQRDSNRDHSPLKKAEDAIVINTSEMSVQDQIDFVIQQVSRKLGDI
jgi:cytidylate kinase